MGFFENQVVPLASEQQAVSPPPQSGGGFFENQVVPLAGADLERRQRAEAAKPRPGYDGFWAQIAGDPGERAGSLIEQGQREGKSFDEMASSFAGLGLDPEKVRPHYEQRTALKAEEARQIEDRGGKRVGVLEQAKRKLIPFGSSIINYNREADYGEAQKRFAKGEASPEDIATIAAYQRRAGADKDTGSVWKTMMDAPAIVGEGFGASKVLGAAGRGLGLLGKAAPAAEAAGYTAKGAFTYAGKALPVAAGMPSMYLQQAAEKNVAAGRPADDIQGLAPALGMAYANVLVLGQLQHLGNTAKTFTGQIGRKAGYGVVEQQIADLGIAGVDQLIPKGWQLTEGKDRAGVLGKFADGEFTSGLKQAAEQMFTFGYFAGLHGKSPRPIKTTFKEAMDEAHGMGLNADAAGRYVDYPRLLLGEALQKNPNLTGDEARQIIKENTPKKGALREYGLSLADAMPRAELANDFTARTVAEKMRRDEARAPKLAEDVLKAREADVTTDDPLTRMGDEGPVPEPREPEPPPPERGEGKPPDPRPGEPPTDYLKRLIDNGMSVAEAHDYAGAWFPGEIPGAGRKGQVPEKEPEKSAVEQLTPAESKNAAKTLGLNAKGWKDFLENPKTARAANAVADSIIKARTPKAPEMAPAGSPAGERAPEGTGTHPVIGDAAGRNAAAAKAQELAKSGQPHTYVDMDVDNMGGLAKKTGDDAAHAHVREAVRIVHEELSKLGPAQVFRHAGDPKGDEHSAVVRAPKAQVDAALRAAQVRIAEYAKANGLDALEYHKKAGVERPFGLTTFAEPFGKGSARDVFAEAEAGTETVKARKGEAQVPFQEPAKPEMGPAETMYERLKAEGVPFTEAFLRATEQGNTVVGEKFAADRVATIPAPANAKATAERRSAPRTNKPTRNDEVSAAERAQNERIEKTTYDSIPKVYRDQIEQLIPEYTKRGYKAEAVRDSYRVIFVAAGHGGVEASIDLFRARTETISEKLLKVSMANAAHADKELDDAAREAGGHAEGGTEKWREYAAGAAERLRNTPDDERFRGVREAAERWDRVKRDLDEGVRRADEAVNGGRAPQATEPPQPRQTEGKSVRFTTVNEAVEALKANRERLALSDLSLSADANLERVRAEIESALSRLDSFTDDQIRTVAKALTGQRGRSAADAKRIITDDVMAPARAIKGNEWDLGGGPRKPKAVRVKTILDDVIEAGGIHRDRTIEGDFNPKEFPHLSRPGLWNASAKGHSLDTMAEHLGMSADELASAMKEQRVSRIQDNTKGFESEYDRHQREQAQAARDRGDTAEWKASDEGIPESRGPRPGEPGHVPEKETGPGQFEMIAEQNKLFDNRNYVEKRVPHVGSAANAVALKSGGIVTAKMSAGSALVNLEENAHHVHMKEKLPNDPSAFPLEVARGIQEFFAPRAHYYGVKAAMKGTPTRLGMMEGFADWLIARSTGGLTGLSANQRAANEYLEKWAGEKGLTEKFDAVKEMYRKHAGLSAESKAALNVSATGKPVDEQGRATIAQKAQEMVDDNLTVLNRVIAKAESLGHKVGRALYDTYSQLMHAPPKWAAQFEKEGVHGYDKEGRRVVMGESWDKIVEGAKPEWLQPGTSGEASRAGTYALARHILGEEARGRSELVAPAQLEQYRAAMEAFKADKEFTAWAEPFADRLTKAFNASNRALASDGVHFLTKEMNEAMEAKYPDYVPTSRVMQDAGWRAGGGSKGEIVGRAIYERSGSGEQIVDPLISYKNRLASTAARMTEQLKRVELLKIARMDGMADFFLLGEKTLTELGKERAERLTAMGFKGEELKRLMEDMAAARDEEYFTTKPWPTDGTKPTLGVWGRDGKLITMRIGDKSLYDLASGQQIEASAAASTLRALTAFWGDWNPLRMMTKAVKFGATSASLGFQFRNIPRDSYEFWKNTVDRATVKDLPGAYKRAFAFAWNQLTQHFGAKASRDVLFTEFDRQRGDQGRQFDFERDKPASAYAPNRGKVVGTAHTIWGVLKDTLRVAGAGELAPRFLEWKTRLQKTTGKTEAQLVAELEAVEKAASEGKSLPDPIPLALALDAMQHAAEVTVNFNRLGTVTREINKITPFFGPAIAGMSKAVRNWKENPKGAAFAMAGLLGLRLLHWLTYSDEDWYKELSANDRYNNFVVPTPAGLRRLPAPRDFEILGGGFLTTMLDAASNKNPDFKGWLKQSAEGLLPPKPLPPALKVAGEVARNENWMGSPIVPKRDEHASTLDKWTDHRLAYVADQMTGGLLGKRNLPEKLADLLPYSEVKNARRSVDEFYDRFKELEAGHAKAKSSGLRFAEEAEYRRLDAAQKRIADLSRALRGERIVDGRVRQVGAPSDEDKARIKSIQIELARRALGK